MFRRGMPGNARVYARAERNPSIAPRRRRKRARSVPAPECSMRCASPGSAPNHTHDGTCEGGRKVAMEISVSIGGGLNMTLSGAVLVYQGGREAFAVWHPAKPRPN